MKTAVPTDPPGSRYSIWGRTRPFSCNKIEALQVRESWIAHADTFGASGFSHALSLAAIDLLVLGSTEDSLIGVVGRRLEVVYFTGDASNSSVGETSAVGPSNDHFIALLTDWKADARFGVAKPASWIIECFASRLCRNSRVISCRRLSRVSRVHGSQVGFGDGHESLTTFHGNNRWLGSPLAVCWASRGISTG